MFINKNEQGELNMESIESLKHRVKELEKENKELKEQLNKLQNKKRGRKNKFEIHDIESMKFYRFQGKSYREIASIFKCSTGLVHKLVNRK